MTKGIGVGAGMWRNGWLAVVFLLCSCKKDPPSPPAPSPEPASADAPSSLDAASGGLDRLDCTGIAPIEEAGTCPTTSRPTDALVRFSERLDELVAMHRPPGLEWWAPGREALDAAKDADPKAMSLAERVSVQNAALRLAVTAKDDLARDALKLVERLAFDPTERAAAAALTSDLSAWLGPPSERTERTKTAPFLHEQVTHHTRVFRLVRTPRLRATFSELIAVDNEGVPFATGVVGSIEIRAGRTLEAPACVALQAPTRIRCGLFDGLREPASLDELPGSHFLRRDELGHLRCNDCHGPNGDSPLVGAIDVAPEGVAEELGYHRRITIMRLRALLDPLRRGDQKK